MAMVTVQRTIYSSVSFFIATESDNLERRKEEFFRLLHEAETDVEIKQINCRKGVAMNLNELAQVVKDFNNTRTKNLVEKSNTCYQQLLEEEMCEEFYHSISDCYQRNDFENVYFQIKTLPGTVQRYCDQTRKGRNRSNAHDKRSRSRD